MLKLRKIPPLTLALSPRRAGRGDLQALAGALRSHNKAGFVS